eukprot:scaffold78224_cov63-Phaeocystis_antarctica.AAC.1
MGDPSRPVPNFWLDPRERARAAGSRPHSLVGHGASSPPHLVSERSVAGSYKRLVWVCYLRSNVCTKNIMRSAADASYAAASASQLYDHELVLGYCESADCAVSTSPRGCFCRQFHHRTTAVVRQRSAAVALLLAGPPPRAVADGAEATHRAHGEAQRDSVVSPLAVVWPVEGIVTCEAKEVAAWRRLLEPALPSLAAAEIALPPPPLRREETRFARRHCSHQFCDRYFVSYLHVFQSYLLLSARERAAGRRYAFVVKGRYDLTFRPGDIISPAWLRTMPGDAVAVPALEFQWSVRWLEGATAGRPGTRTARWPNAMNDQLAFGRRAPMHAYLGLLLANRTSPGGSGLGRRGAAREAAAQAEAILADHCVTRGVRVLTVELQLAKPTDRQRRSAAVPWLSNSSCCFCFDARRGGVAGVGREL